MNFRVGQKVVCVDAAPREGSSPWEPCERLSRGAVYTVTSVHLRCGEPTLWLAERTRSLEAIEWHGPLVGYGDDRFRPVIERKPDISIFVEMLKPKQRELISP